MSEPKSKNLSEFDLMRKAIDAFFAREYEEAIKCSSKTIELSPDSSLAWQMKGYAFCELRKFDEALECLNRAIELNPKNADAWYKKGWVIVALGKEKEEKEKKKGILEKLTRVFTLSECKRATMVALACFRKATEINPEHTDAWGSIGSMLEDMGMSIEAMKYYDKYMDLREKKHREENELFDTLFPEYGTHDNDEEPF